MKLIKLCNSCDLLLYSVWESSWIRDWSIDVGSKMNRNCNRSCDWDLLEGLAPPWELGSSNFKIEMRLQMLT